MNIKYLVKDGSGDQYVPIYPFHQETYEQAGGGPGSGSLVNKKLRIAVTVNIADESRSYTLLNYGYFLIFSEIEVQGERHTFPISGQSPFTWQFDKPGEYTFYVTLRPEFPSAGPVFYSIQDQITSISLPYGIETLPPSFFQGISMPNVDIVLPSSVKYLKPNKGQFGGCRLHKLVIPKNCIVNAATLSGCAPEILEFHGTYIDAETVPFGMGSGYLQIDSTYLKKLIIDCRNTQIASCQGMPVCEEIEVSGNVETILSECFNGCSQVKKVTLSGNKLKEIQNAVFRDCSSLTSITIPDNVTSIGDSAFRDCSGLTSIEIPNGVTSIGQYAFRSCSGLTSINVNDGNTVYDSRNNCNAIIETETNTLIQGCNTTIIPDSVTSIGNTAFERCTSLTSVTIGNGVTSIGSGVFQYCSGLTSVTIPDSVTSIGTHVFNGCTSLTSCTIGSGVTSISQATFRNCSGLTSVDLPNRVTSIGDYAFSGCTSLEEVTIPNGVTSIYSSTFAGCSSLTSVTIPDSVTSIGGSCFYNCTSLTSIVIPDSVTSIGTWVFQGCSGLTSCTIGNSITNIVEGTFGYCSSLTSIVIPNGVTVIGQYAFYQCYSLTSINIPDSVTSIGYQAFRDCTSLTSIVSNAMKAPTIQGQTFRNVKTGGTLTVPTGSTGYDVWMGTGNYYLGKYNWTKVEQTSGQGGDDEVVP